MTEQARVAAGSERRNRSTLIRLVVSAFLMFGFGYALVPFYEKLCQVLDVNNLNKQDNTLPLAVSVTLYHPSKDPDGYSNDDDAITQIIWLPAGQRGDSIFAGSSGR